MRRAGTTNNGISTSDRRVICHEIDSITANVSVSVTTLETTPDSVSENARCAPITSLPSLLTSAPVRVRVKNATGIRWTWSNTAVRRSRIRPSPIVDDSQRVTSDTAVSATATNAMTAANSTTTPVSAAAHDLVDDLSGEHRRGDGEQRAHHADRDEPAQPAVMPMRETPDTAQQLPVDEGAQVSAAGVRLPVQRLPRDRLHAHEITVKPQQWMRSKASRRVGPGSCSRPAWWPFQAAMSALSATPSARGRETLPVDSQHKLQPLGETCRVAARNHCPHFPGRVRRGCSGPANRASLDFAIDVVQGVAWGVFATDYVDPTDAGARPRSMVPSAPPRPCNRAATRCCGPFDCYVLSSSSQPCRKRLAAPSAGALFGTRSSGAVLLVFGRLACDPRC